MTEVVAPIKNVTLEPRDYADLSYAKSLLENPGFAVRVASLLGAPIEKGFKLLPGNWSKTVHGAVHRALRAALRVALTSLRSKPRAGRASIGFHRVVTGLSGGIGGAFGFAALPVELPFSTTVMLRSIADIARHEGHDLRDPETRLACLEVFALGGRSHSDDAAENAYWAMRVVLSQAVSEAAAHVTQRGMLQETAPALVRLISLIGARFGVVVSEQIAAKAVPVIGAAAGSAINVLFTSHFQAMARGHFIVRRLEKTYGPNIVREVYAQIALPPG
ncbi:MAG TPA: peptidase [Verrucomicrobiales bacterium]|nr:peptidase [Verrucomicrobiales bacterium]